MARSDSIDLLIASEPEQRKAVFRFRYKRLVHDMGGDYAAADHRNRTIADRADENALHLCLTVNQKLVATVRIQMTKAALAPVYLADRFNLDVFADQQDPVISLTDMLVTAEEIHGKPTVGVLMAGAYKIVRSKGSLFDFADAAPSEVLIHEQLGYRQYHDNFLDDDRGYRVPLVLPTSDVDHLLRVGSPYARIARNMSREPNSVNWFYKTFGDIVSTSNTASMSEDEIWAYLTRRLSQTPLHGIPLLRDLQPSDATRLLNACTVLSCKEGDRVVGKGDVGNELYVILSGMVQVQDEGVELATLEQGAIFGEMSFIASEKRSADIYAIADSELLILSQDRVNHLMQHMPEVAARVLFNLSSILINRLRSTTEQVSHANSQLAGITAELTALDRQDIIQIKTAKQ